MAEFGSGLKFWALAAAMPIAFTGCVGETPPNEIAAPDLSKITVFYPVDGVVRGRGLEGAIRDSSIRKVRIAAHPTQTNTLVDVNLDGSFDFSIIAISDDLLEITAARDEEGVERGDPVYIVVPPTPLPPPEFVCCGATPMRRGTCQPVEEAKMMAACPDPATGITECNVDRECGVESGELLQLDQGSLNITPPDADGRVTINGTVTANTLITMENRGQSAIGGYTPSQRRIATISDEAGRFTFKRVIARGDDELIFQTRDLNGFRSPQTRKMVPDSPIEGVDVVSAFAFSILASGEVGSVAILMQPFGMDGRGICPDAPMSNPILCLGGGLTYDMVNLTNLTIDGDPVTYTRTTTTPARPHNRGLIGGDDPMAGPQDIVVIFDNSAGSESKDDPQPTRYETVHDFIRGLRSRDRVALISFNQGVVTTDAELNAPRADVLQAMMNMPPPDGVPRIYEAVQTAANMLSVERNRRPGRIVTILFDNEPGIPGGMNDPTVAFDAAFEMVRSNPSQGFDGYVVDVVAVGLDAVVGTDPTSLSLTTDLAGFTGGEFKNLRSINKLAPELADLRTQMSGSFIMLYDMTIPPGVGKQGTISFTAEVTVQGKQVSSVYSGPLVVTEQ